MEQDSEDDMSDEKIMYIFGLPKIETKIDYSEYVKNLRKNINDAKKFIKKYESLEKILESAKTINKSVIKKLGENAELFLNCKRAYYGMINEFVEVTNKNFNNEEYYFFIFQNIFKKVEKSAYNPSEDEKISDEVSSFYM